MSELAETLRLPAFIVAIPLGAMLIVRTMLWLKGQKLNGDGPHTAAQLERLTEAIKIADRLARIEERQANQDEELARIRDWKHKELNQQLTTLSLETDMTRRKVDALFQHFDVRKEG